MNRRGNMTWGHAVSPDMLHWTQWEPALEPDKLGTRYSGSAVVDWGNTAGLQKGAEKTVVLVYTPAGGTYELTPRKYGYGSCRIFALPIREIEALWGTPRPSLELFDASAWRV